MMVEYIRYTIPAGRADALLLAHEHAAEGLRASPVCLGYELSRCAEAPESFVLRIVCRSIDDHLKGFRARAELRPFLAAVRRYLPNIEEMRHYEPTRVAWSR